ncbi:hypothetical protein BT96DRAFT_821498 [Gymnopus androsaceus JB14]|uniref:Uncharacterized protein n=1 Tax=Gymnopus androsaceus JB14 TaxID=1447944 RepID=A0A6A4HNX5_9AGAR|nr:hypothetical protein BT96DRAFT_821498 [Gymnopus androsaceus JB14]
MEKAALRKERVNYVNLQQHPALQISGAKLSKTTQGLAYRIIKHQQTNKANAMTRSRTEANLDKIKLSVEDRFGYTPTTEAIWTSIHHKDFECKIHDFLWMVTQDAYWTGMHWLCDSMKPELHTPPMIILQPG